MPVIPATQEAEAGELREPRRRRLRWAEIAPLHSSLGNKSETPSQKKKKKDFGGNSNPNHISTQSSQHIQWNFLKNTKDILHRNRKIISKILMEPQKTLNSQSYIEQKEKNLEELYYLYSNYTTEL